MTPSKLKQERETFENWLKISGVVATDDEFSVLCQWIEEDWKYKSALINGLFHAWLACAKQFAWISVEEKLPEPSNRQLLTLWEDGEITIGKYLQFGNGRIEWNESRFDRSRELTITYWYPLPECPQNSADGRM